MKTLSLLFVVTLLACGSKGPGPDGVTPRPGETPSPLPPSCDATDASRMEIEASPGDLVSMSYTATFNEAGIVLAPAAQVMLEGVEQPVGMTVGANADDTVELAERLAANKSAPVSLSFTLKSETSYGSVVESGAEGPVEVAGACMATFTHRDGTTTAGRFGCTAWLLLAMAPPVAGCGWFDCHSHWGIGSTQCHCNTAACCPGSKCQCNTRGDQYCTHGLMTPCLC